MAISGHDSTDQDSPQDRLIALDVPGGGYVVPTTDGPLKVIVDHRGNGRLPNVRMFTKGAKYLPYNEAVRLLELVNEHDPNTCQLAFGRYMDWIQCLWCGRYVNYTAGTERVVLEHCLANTELPVELRYHKICWGREQELRAEEDELGIGDLDARVLEVIHRRQEQRRDRRSAVRDSKRS